MVRLIASLLLYPLATAVFLLGVGCYLTAVLVISPRRLHPLARFVSRAFLWSSGQRLRVASPPPDPAQGPYLYLFNHASLFDVFVLAATLPHYVTSVGKQEQFSWPVWGRLVRRYGVIPIQREHLQAAIHSLDRMETVLQEGISCIIAPEGTRTLDGKLGPFKKGPFHVALNTGVTLVPVGIVGAFAAKPKNDWRLRPGVLTVRYGTPIPHREYAHMTVEELRDFVRAKIIKLTA
jgi:1-acyl-sn-glycerol-3-phosphate acyltransferase